MAGAAARPSLPAVAAGVVAVAVRPRWRRTTTKNIGTKKLPNLGSDLGKAIRGFKKGVSEGEPEKLEADGKTETSARSESKDRVE